MTSTSTSTTFWFFNQTFIEKLQSFLNKEKPSILPLLTLLNAFILMAILFMAVLGYRLRGFKSAVVAVFTTLAFFSGVFLGQPIIGLFTRAPDSPAFPLKLIVFGGIMFGVYLISRIIAKKLWFSENVMLIKPIDSLLGFASGIWSGAMIAGMVSFLCFTSPKFDFDLYPPEVRLSLKDHWKGSHPTFHAPYRMIQLVALFSHITGGKRIQSGAIEAELVTGPLVHQFYGDASVSPFMDENRPVDVKGVPIPQRWRQFFRKMSEK